MFAGYGQAEPGGVATQAPGVVPGVPVAASSREIPYDYVATFRLTGQAGNRLQDVINVSVEGAFVSVAIGYSVLRRRQPVERVPEREVRGVRELHGAARRLERVVEQVKELKSVSAAALAGLGLPFEDAVARAAQISELLEGLMLRFSGFDFLYGIVDSASGRELQNQLIHNMAGLGNALGDRPFRMFAKPILFMPRSSIRIEIVEQTQGALYEDATLYFVLHGYKLLGYGVPQP